MHVLAVQCRAGYIETYGVSTDQFVQLGSYDVICESNVCQESRIANSDAEKLASHSTT